VEAVQVNWEPPAGGNVELIEALDKLMDDEKIEEANQEAIERIMGSQPILVDIDQAKNVIPGMHEKKILHAGPPIEWERMCGPQQGAIIGALIYEGLAKNEDEARELASSGEIDFSPCNEHATVGPMAGVVSPSMPVHIVENKTYGNKAFCTVNEGLGKVLRFGAFSSEVIDRLKWIETTYAPALKKALSLSAGFDIKSLTAQALHMGDECHNRNRASTSLFFREIARYFLKTDLDNETVDEVL